MFQYQRSLKSIWPDGYYCFFMRKGGRNYLHGCEGMPFPLKQMQMGKQIGNLALTLCIYEVVWCVCTLHDPQMSSQAPLSTGQG